jgi:hypothetical protein
MTSPFAKLERSQTTGRRCRAMRSVLIVLGPVWGLVMVVGCGSGAEPRSTAGVTTPAASSAPSSPSSAPSSAAKTPALVGEWQRTQTCAELQHILAAAHLEYMLLIALARDNWIPGVTEPSQIKDPRHPCRGAVARKHSHFFTADGKFGSRDQNGQQVDEGSYYITNPGTVVINNATFHYRITGGGNTISFEPAQETGISEWSVNVAYPGYTWHRIA